MKINVAEAAAHAPAHATVKVECTIEREVSLDRLDLADWETGDEPVITTTAELVAAVQAIVARHHGSVLAFLNDSGLLDNEDRCTNVSLDMTLVNAEPSLYTPDQLATAVEGFDYSGGDGTMTGGRRSTCVHCGEPIIYLRMGDWWHNTGERPIYLRCNGDDS